MANSTDSGKLPMSGSITLRPVTTQDEPFLYNLYKLSRAEEFSAAPFTDAQFDALMRMQYSARKGSYEAQFPGADHSVVAVDGTDAGQVWIFRDNSQHRLVDISILTPYQNKGLGTRLVNDLIQQARTAGLPLTCSVATNNPGSLRFHQRLGFHITSQNELYYQLEYPSNSSAGLASTQES